jgi:hypothetical protein
MIPTPKEKAKELVDKYRTYIRAGDKYEYLDPEDELHLAKQCALIAVFEIIDQWEYIHAYIANGMGELNPNLKYWQEVEHELNKSE